MNDVTARLSRIEHILAQLLARDVMKTVSLKATHMECIKLLEQTEKMVTDTMNSSDTLQTQTLF